MSMTQSPQEEVRAYNKRKAGFLTKLAWTIEIVLVLTGVGIAVAQAASLGAGASLWGMAPVFGVFLILAFAELSKIPAATVAFHARSWSRLLATLALIVASAISFETIFNGFERFSHLSTTPVRDAQLHLADLEAQRAGLAEVALSEEADLATITAMDVEQRAILQAAVASAQAAFDAAVSNQESFETRELRAQLEAVVAQQSAAIAQAGEEWDREQQSIERRIRPDSGIDEALRTQLQARMRAMPARQSVTTQAAAQFASSITDLQSRIEASISEPSPEIRAQIATAGALLQEARDALTAFEAEASSNQRERVAQAREDIASARRRADVIEELEADIAAAKRSHSEAAASSQMHRWASFAYGVNPDEVTDAQAKQIGAVFGAALAFAASLAGSITAVFAEWFRVRGVQPVSVEVRVEVPVEVQVPVKVEVPVETNRFIYVPIPDGFDVNEVVEDLLSELPPAVAADLRRQMRMKPSAVSMRMEGSDAA